MRHCPCLRYVGPCPRPTLLRPRYLRRGLTRALHVPYTSLTRRLLVAYGSLPRPLHVPCMSADAWDCCFRGVHSRATIGRCRGFAGNLCAARGQRPNDAALRSPRAQAAFVACAPAPIRPSPHALRGSPCFVPLATRTAHGAGVRLSSSVRSCHRWAAPWSRSDAWNQLLYPRLARLSGAARMVWVEG